MINLRYSSQKMQELWSEFNKYETWLAVERVMIKAICDSSTVNIVDEISLLAINIQDIVLEEQLVKHDVLAFVNVMIRQLSPQASSYFHRGLTSSDIVDTATSIRLRHAADYIKKALLNCLVTIHGLREEYKNVKLMGRTHGQYAEVMTLNDKFDLWLDELTRDVNRVALAYDEVSYGKLSGPVGNNYTGNRDLEERALHLIGLKPAVANQIIPRDRYVHFCSVCTIAAGTIAKIAADIWGLARSDVGEITYVNKGAQKGSSSMPHKQNPWPLETIWGLTRIIRAYNGAMLESQFTWHERDISNSSVERFALPGITSLTEYVINSLTDVLLDHLVFNVDIMQEHINETKPTGKLLTVLQTCGVDRGTAYNLCEKITKKINNGTPDDEAIRECLCAILSSEDEVNKTMEEIGWQ
jgi:adenylosuccinate lyase